MRNLSESTRSHGISRPRSSTPAFGRSITAFAAALLSASSTASTGCGAIDFDGYNHDRSGQPDVCEKKPTPPKPTVLHNTHEGNRLRVQFMVPKFDGKCLLPIRVSVLATTSRAPGSGGYPYPSIELESGVVITNAPESPLSTFADFTIPSQVDGIPSFQLVLTGANGERANSDTQSMNP